MVHESQLDERCKPSRELNSVCDPLSGVNGNGTTWRSHDNMPCTVVVHTNTLLSHKICQAG